MRAHILSTGEIYKQVFMALPDVEVLEKQIRWVLRTNHAASAENCECSLPFNSSPNLFICLCVFFNYAQIRLRLLSGLIFDCLHSNNF